MPNPRVLALTVLIVSGALMARGVPASQDAQIDRQGLDNLLQGMGYETKALGEQATSAFEFVVQSEWTIYLSAQVSSSKRYLWFLVNLGETTQATKFEQLLKENAKIQPSMFYITKEGRLYCGLAVENRGLDAVRMRTAIDMVTKAITGSQSVWAKGEGVRLER